MAPGHSREKRERERKRGEREKLFFSHTYSSSSQSVTISFCTKVIIDGSVLKMVNFLNRFVNRCWSLELIVCQILHSMRTVRVDHEISLNHKHHLKINVFVDFHQLLWCIISIDIRLGASESNWSLLWWGRKSSSMHPRLCERGFWQARGGKSTQVWSEVNWKW